MPPTVVRNNEVFRVDVHQWTGVGGAALCYDPRLGTLQPWRSQNHCCDKTAAPPWGKINNHYGPTCLYVIPNRRCNFHCSYCYAAGTRDGSEMDATGLDGLLEGVYRTKKEGSSIRIVFMGGGEPLLSLKLLEYGIQKARKLEQEHGVRTEFGIVTNGSLLTESVEEILAEGNVNVDVSFEVLKDVQEAQRGEYESVAENIRRASSKIPVVIRTVATELNVNRLEETVHEIVGHYPHVHAWRCDPEMGATGRSFFAAYTKHFIGALALAENNGWNLKVENIATRCLKQPTALFCSDLWVAGPTGRIVRCPCDDGTDSGLIGQFNARGVDLIPDRKAYHPELISSKCCRCFLRWNCAGGCPARRHRSTSRNWDELCRSHRTVASWVLAKCAEKTWGADWADRWTNK